LKARKSLGRRRKKVFEICTKYAQKGMSISFSPYSSAPSPLLVEPFFFIGYLISIADLGLYQAIFMANAGGAWDNAKKIVETELKKKGTPCTNANGRRRHVATPSKYILSGAEPGYQVHHAFGHASRRTGGQIEVAT